MTTPRSLTALPARVRRRTATTVGRVLAVLGLLLAVPLAARATPAGGRDDGMSTAEYAVGTVAAVAFAAARKTTSGDVSVGAGLAGSCPYAGPWRDWPADGVNATATEPSKHGPSRWIGRSHLTGVISENVRLGFAICNSQRQPLTSGVVRPCSSPDRIMSRLS